MKWYIASRTKHIDYVNYLYKTLEKCGEKVTFNWTKIGNLKPFKENQKECTLISKKIISAVKKSDIFVLISDEGGSDMFMELGVAIANYNDLKKPKIYHVGKYNERALMHFDSSINRIKSIEDVFRKECPKILENERIKLIEL